MTFKCIPRIMFLVVVVWLAVAATPTDAVAQCCTLPTTETSANVGVNTDDPPLSYTQSKFLQTLGAGDYIGRRVQEKAGASTNSDQCREQTSGQSPFDPANLSGGSWPVVTDNKWGWDAVGYRADLVAWYRDQGVQLFGVTLPCGSTVYQDMEIECDSNTYWRYEMGNVLTSTIYEDHVENCRQPTLGQGACGVINQ